MSIKEIIKKHLLTENKKFQKITTKITHCQNKCYKYYLNSNNYQFKICNKKINYLEFKEINHNRWHFYFSCFENHLVIRWVIIKDNNINIGNLKN